MDLSDPLLPYTALPIEGVVAPFAFTYDPVDNQVYWSDLSSGTINRAHLDGRGRETLLGPYNGIRSKFERYYNTFGRKTSLKTH